MVHGEPCGHADYMRESVATCEYLIVQLTVNYWGYRQVQGAVPIGEHRGEM